MRADLAVAVALAVALALPGVARADQPDPTVIAPVQPEAATAESLAPPSGDPCDRDARCRLARFGAELAHRRRVEYVQRVQAEAAVLDARFDRQRPWRERYPIGVDFATSSNQWSYALTASLTPQWWARVSASVGNFKHSQSVNYAGRYYSTTNEGVLVGTALRVLPVKWALSPYGHLGWTYYGGRISGYYYQRNAADYPNGEAVSHLVTVGAGLELTVPYFHIALGYSYFYAFYTQSYVNKLHDDGLKLLLQGNLDGDRHGVAFEIGTVF